MSLPSTSPSSPSPLNPPAIPPPSAPKRKRGGQPGNLNARKGGTFSLLQPGPLYEIRQYIRLLNSGLRLGALPPQVILDQSHALLKKTVSMEQETSPLESTLLEMKLVKLSMAAISANLPELLCQRTLETLACDPFDFFELGYQDSGIARDADSFFPVPKLSARNSPSQASGSPALPPLGGSWRQGESPPPYATNLTDEQWAVLAPLIPPDPAHKWLSGQPPVIIAASRWGLTRYLPTGNFQDFEIMQKHDQILQRCPALLDPDPPARSAKKRGRPREGAISPRALLDAIFWKLATGRTWSELPFEFPPMRLCRKYYRRLFLSGRFYTLLLALHHHMRSECIDPSSLLEQGVFTTTPSQHIALSPGVIPTWQNCTALLFLQLARDAYLHLEREKKREDRFYPNLRRLKGFDPLSTCCLPASGDPKPPHEPVFQPLESSLAAKKWRQQFTRRERAIQARLRDFDRRKPSFTESQELPDE